jgi:hypothetical protein
MNIFTKDAKRFRLTLSVLLFIIVIATILALFFSIKYLNSYSKTVSESVNNARNSQSKINNLKSLELQLKNEKNSDAISKVRSVVADSKSYSYQDVIIKDITAMASNANIKIQSFNFSTSGTGSTGATSAPAPAAPSTPSSGSTGDSSGTSTTPASGSSALKSTKAEIAIENPVSYNDLLIFLHYIEQNNTKMQLSGISISAAEDNEVSVATLSIEVYIR